MAVSQSKPSRNRIRAKSAALVLLAVSYATPMLAASPNALLCDETGEATLEFPFLELITKNVDHDISMTTLDEIAAAIEKKEMSPARLLAPQAEAAIRNAFSDEEANATVRDAAQFTRVKILTPVADSDEKAGSDNDNTQQDTSNRLTTRLPGVSDDDLSRYRKQMYRRDI